MSFPSRRRVIVLTLISVLLAINLYFGFHRGGSDPIADQELADQRTRDTLLERWASAAGVPLKDGPELLQAIQRIPTNDCMTLTTDARLVEPSALPPSSHDDLIHAIGQFLLCYSSQVAGDPNSLFNLMSARKEQLPRETVELLRTLMVNEGGKSRAELASKTAPEILATYLGLVQCERPMSELLVEESCLSIRDVKHLATEGSQGGFSREDHRLWNNQVGLSKLSRAARTVEQEAMSRGSVLMAHARLLVRHDADHFAISFPYHLELWYDTTERAWHFHSLEYFPTSTSTTTRIIF